MMKGKQAQVFIEPLQVYSRRKTVTQSMSVQQPNSIQGPDPKFNLEIIEVTTSSFPQNENVSKIPNSSDYDIPNAIRKGNKACTKYPLHLFLSYKNLSNNHPKPCLPT